MRHDPEGDRMELHDYLRKAKNDLRMPFTELGRRAGVDPSKVQAFASARRGEINALEEARLRATIDLMYQEIAASQQPVTPMDRERGFARLAAVEDQAVKNRADMLLGFEALGGRLEAIEEVLVRIVERLDGLERPGRQSAE